MSDSAFFRFFTRKAAPARERAQPASGPAPSRAEDAMQPPLWRNLRLSPCECGPRDLVRLRRPEWLRWLVPSRRLYRCPHCGSTVLYGR